ncbi:hypothetical protein J7W19_26110 [Streptomyces mobaraensis NBRC 13819 = DSM 40847]|uniref:Uncharacterized protein n=1 Tax=Streptomyces mobaraensis (strain ATCC 29032 / DSM 40847 / JCM 4168 / NBRC 13819 / NCIMB 11159 / IPCR 16-22) TaxID=1223523 RepID=M3CD84_STRM1|nr:hypothetical protein [Streptomyces mobaraensis]EMF02027.1 hypothetical protein H340_03359 [Streptomyces mobaraensis NBRC 13819 = DSM 40847]QTT76390.1 hypothetical protein J7W19_26110 [Streptomyces mobaraensis NBRC 13819 = DSM 40847]
MSEKGVERDDFDSLVASVSAKVTAEQVEEAQRVSQALSESPSEFGPVVMFALDKN